MYVWVFCSLGERDEEVVSWEATEESCEEEQSLSALSRRVSRCMCAKCSF